MTAMRSVLTLAIFLMASGDSVSSRRLSQQQAPGQQPAEPPARGAISGVVIDGASGSPVPDALVSLGGGTLPREYQRRLLSDARGRFVFLNLPDATGYQVTVWKFGHLEGGYGRDAAPTDPLRRVVISNGAWVPNLRVPLWKPGAITGTVVDESGEPVVGVFVRALKKIRIGTRDELAVGAMTVTDDHGRYRLHGVAPGRYVLQVPSVQQSVPASTNIRAATTSAPEGALDVDDTNRLVIGRYPLPPPPLDGRLRAYPLAFHPNGASVADATVVEVKFGEERSAIDIALTPTPAVRISGTVEGPPEVMKQLTLRLLAPGLENLGNGAEVATALASGDGSFTFMNVPAGMYTIDVPARVAELTIAGTTGGASLSFASTPSIPPPPPQGGWGWSQTNVDLVPGLGLRASDYRGGSGGNYSARVPVTVGSADITGLVVRLRPQATVKGQITFERDPARPDVPLPTRVFVMLDPASGSSALSAQANAANVALPAFELPGIMPGEYFVRVRSAFPSPTGNVWLLKSATYRGRDVASTSLAIGGDDVGDVLVTVTNAVASLAGSVRTQSGVAPDSALVVIFPVDPARRSNQGLFPSQMKSTTITPAGTYSFPALPAGDYFVAAIDRSRASTWHDPEYLAQLERSAVRVSLAWGQPRSTDVTFAGGR